ncbi:helix-turn-helix domain-containing protein [Gordonia sp. C13]|uniref:helix-turn-helix domain-containing protein n=1 Tax=Gordonia sp. C13 TaxID=2935078 RepID=UPI00200A45BF|nr:helix-turn-helix domain-containing protein [Gordonia sp. C13]MCK8613398.1 helix-turn-helix domain-containing protein [Gordonia sp. C13]
MATVGDVADRLGLLTLTPAPAERTLRLQVSRAVELGDVPLTAVAATDVVCVAGVGWTAVGEPDSFAAAIRECGVPAIVVDTDDDRLSAEFVSSCVQHGVPIYMLPRERTFADLIGCFVPQTPVAGKADSDAGQVSVITDVLADFYRKSGIIGAVVLRGAVIAASPSSVDLDLVSKTIALAPVPMHTIPGTAAALHVALPNSGAALALSNPNRRPFEPTRVRKLANDTDRAVQILAAQRAMRRTLEEALLRELIDARIPAAAMDPWVESFGYVAGDRVRAVAVIVGPQSDTTPTEVVEALHDLGVCSGMATVAAARDSEVFALIKTGTEKEPNPLARSDFDAQLATFERMFVARYAGLAMGGSSYVIRSSDDLMRGLINARQMAERQSRAQDPEGGSAITLSVPLAATLLAGVPERAKTLHDSVLGPVLAYDQGKDTSYLSTLTTFFALDCHSGATANELGIHINTLRYRLSRIEKLTGRSLASTADRTDYYLALCVGEAIGDRR